MLPVCTHPHDVRVADPTEVHAATGGLWACDQCQGVAPAVREPMWRCVDERCDYDLCHACFLENHVVVGRTSRQQLQPSIITSRRGGGNTPSTTMTTPVPPTTMTTPTQQTPLPRGAPTPARMMTPQPQPAAPPLPPSRPQSRQHPVRMGPAPEGTVVKVLCHEHPIVVCNPQIIHRSSEGYWQCNVCQRFAPAAPEPMFHCPNGPCDYDVCNDCVQRALCMTPLAALGAGGRGNATPIDRGTPTAMLPMQYSPSPVPLESSSSQSGLARQQQQQQRWPSSITLRPTPSMLPPPPQQQQQHPHPQQPQPPQRRHHRRNYHQHTSSSTSTQLGEDEELDPRAMLAHDDDTLDYSGNSLESADCSLSMSSSSSSVPTAAGMHGGGAISLGQQVHPHRLIVADPNKVYACIKGGWKCNGCLRLSPDAPEPMYHCPEESCDFDMCSECYHYGVPPGPCWPNPTTSSITSFTASTAIIPTPSSSSSTPANKPSRGRSLLSLFGIGIHSAPTPPPQPSSTSSMTTMMPTTATSMSMPLPPPPTAKSNKSNTPVPPNPATMRSSSSNSAQRPSYKVSTHRHELTEKAPPANWSLLNGVVVEWSFECDACGRADAEAPQPFFACPKWYCSYSLCSECFSFYSTGVDQQQHGGEIIMCDSTAAYYHQQQYHYQQQHLHPHMEEREEEEGEEGGEQQEQAKEEEEEDEVIHRVGREPMENARLYNHPHPAPTPTYHFQQQPQQPSDHHHHRQHQHQPPVGWNSPGTPGFHPYHQYSSMGGAPVMVKGSSSIMPSSPLVTTPTTHVAAPGGGVPRVPISNGRGGVLAYPLANRVPK